MEVQECGHERSENVTKFPRPTQKLDGVINTDWTPSKAVFPTSEFLPELSQGGLDSRAGLCFRQIRTLQRTWPLLAVVILIMLLLGVMSLPT